MYKNFIYLLLFVITLLLQMFLFNNLMISVYLNPLVYMAFLALLPLETPRGVLLMAGLATGLAADWTMGSAGVNTIATVFAAFVRPAVLDMLFGKENIRDGGIPSPERFGNMAFLRYLVFFILLHHLFFFALEALSWVHIGRTLLRVVLSGAVTVGFTWLAAPVITSKLSVRI